MEGIVIDSKLQDNSHAVMEGITSKEINMHWQIKTENSVDIKEDYHAIAEGIDCEETKTARQLETFDMILPISSEIHGILTSEQSLEIHESILRLNDVKSLPLLCRLCATQSNDLIYIFGSTELQENIVHKIEDCLPISVKKTDALPKQICLLCLEKLELCYHFSKTVTQAEKQLLMFEEQTAGRFEDTEEYCQVFPQCNEQCVAIEHEEKLNTVSDEDANNNKSTIVHKKLQIADTTVDDGISSANLKPFSSGYNNVSQDCSRTKSSSDEHHSSDSLMEGLNSGSISAPQIEQGNCYSALNDQMREAHLKEKSKSDEGVTTDSELYSPPITRSRRTFNCLRKETRIDKSHDDIQLSCEEAVEHHTATDVGCKSIECLICGETYKTVEECHIHANIHVSTNYYPCCFCDEILTTETDWKKHWMEHGTKGEKAERKTVMYGCNECGEKFISKVRLKSHKLSHDSRSTKQYHCTKCDAVVDSNRSLEKHMLVVHRQHKKPSNKIEKSFLCSHCGKVLTSKRNLVRHIRIHTGEKLYDCDLCAKAFSYKQSRDEHRRIHTGERPYKCDICGKTFNYIRVLIDHANVHSKKKPHSCSICDKSYKYRGSRNRHMIATHHTAYRTSSPRRVK